MKPFSSTVVPLGAASCGELPAGGSPPAGSPPGQSRPGGSMERDPPYVCL